LLLVKDDWFVVEMQFDCHPFPLHCLLDSMARGFPNTLGRGVRDIIMLFEGGTLRQLMTHSDYGSLSREAVRKLSQPSFARTVADNSRKGVESVMAAANEIRGQDLRACSNKKLASLVQRVSGAFFDSGQWGIIISVAEYYQSSASGIIKKLISSRKLSKAEAEEAFQSLCHWPETTFVYREHKELLELAGKVVKAGGLSNGKVPPSLQKEFSAHCKKFEWTAFSFQGPALDEQYFLSSLADAIRTGETSAQLEQKEKQASQKRLQWLKHLILTPQELAVVNSIAELFYLKALRKDAEHYCNYAMSFLFKEASRRLAIPLSRVRFMLGAELAEALNAGKTDEKLLVDREKTFAYGLAQGKPVNAAGKFAEKFAQFAPQQEHSIANELRGDTACAGKATGVARVILAKSDYPKFRDGDVLISFATNPNMVPLMKRASAIVTEVGGMTCHAAIVSRELGIPCLVSVKKATSAIKDGEKLEVDASQGIVRRL